MTLDEAIALSLLEDLSRVGLTDRLRCGDPALTALAAPCLTRAREVRVLARDAGIHALAWNDTRYPAGLLAIPDCAPVLWYRGVLASLDAPVVAIVGSRAATAVALETAARLAADLAARGVTVISGLARGVDSAAHRGALRTGRTVAVLGSGPDCIYPSEHRPLARQIEESGLVVSEYPPGTPPLPFHFPMRNRLISGLSMAVVVVEASEGSGSLITAARALDQGRDVMAVPGNVLSGRNKGGHALIRDGARIVESADDIVEELGLGDPPSRRRGNDRSANTSVVSVDPILRRMEAGEAYDLDALSSSSGLDVARLLPRLIDLELRGLIRRAGGGRFRRSDP